MNNIKHVVITNDPSESCFNAAMLIYIVLPKSRVRLFIRFVTFYREKIGTSIGDFSADSFESVGENRSRCDASNAVSSIDRKECARENASLD